MAECCYRRLPSYPPGSTDLLALEIEERVLVCTSRESVRQVCVRVAFCLTTHSTHFIYCVRFAFCLTTHSTHFIYGYMALDIR